MQQVSFLCDLDAIDEHFVAALRAITGASRVLVLDTWLGCDKKSWEPGRRADSPSDLYIEWFRRPGRYGLEAKIFGRHQTIPNMSEAELCRSLALRLNRPFLIGDCIPFPFSYFRINPDGSMDEVVCRRDDAQGEHYDLLSDLPSDYPDYYPATPIWRADKPFPRKPEDAPDVMPFQQRGGCDDAAKLCETFWAKCPKRERPDDRT